MVFSVNSVNSVNSANSAQFVLDSLAHRTLTGPRPWSTRPELFRFDQEYLDAIPRLSVISVSPMTDRLLHRELTDAILGAFFDVHSELGYGFLEAVYANAMAVLLRQAGFRVEREVPYEIIFHDERVGRYRADLVVESKVIIEVKTAEVINPIYTMLVTNYLRASQLQVGLLVNFGHKAQFRRVYLPSVSSSRTS